MRRSKEKSTTQSWLSRESNKNPRPNPGFQGVKEKFWTHSWPPVGSKKNPRHKSGLRGVKENPPFLSKFSDLCYERRKSVPKALKGWYLHTCIIFISYSMMILMKNEFFGFSVFFSRKSAIFLIKVQRMF